MHRDDVVGREGFLHSQFRSTTKVKSLACTLAGRLANATRMASFDDVRIHSNMAGIVFCSFLRDAFLNFGTRHKRLSRSFFGFLASASHYIELD
jgi:hypothetical protein